MNSGTVIKILAIILAAILLIMLTVALITAIDSYEYDSYYYMSDRETEVPATVWIFYVVGVLFSLCFGIVLYGFGALIDSNISINKKMNQLIANTRQPQAPPATPAIPQPAYVPPFQSAPTVVTPAAPVPAQNASVTPPVTPAPMAPMIDEPTMVFPVLSDLNQEAPVVDVPTEEIPAGWTCSNCGAQYPTLTPFCRNCGSKRI